MSQTPAQKRFKPGQFFLFGVFMIFAIVFLDQYSKWVVLETMLRTEGEQPLFWDWFTTRQTLEFFVDQREAYESKTITSFLNFVMVWNNGISFGLFSDDTSLDGNKTMTLVFIALSLLISILMFVWLAVARNRMLAWALAMIVGGAIGNVIDRVRFGAVADFVDVHVAGYHWPAFNLADSCIAVGAVFLVLDTMISKEKNPFFN